MNSETTRTASNTAIGDIQERTVATTANPIEPPRANAPYIVDPSVIDAFPTTQSKILEAFHYGTSLWGSTHKIIVELPSGRQEAYFLKVVELGEIGRQMCCGECESLKEIYAVSPGFVPKPHAWSNYRREDPKAYFLLTEFREVGEQPARPYELATRLADLHQRSVSPTGKFGFHVRTCHAKIVQAVGQWHDFWAALFGQHLGHIMKLAGPILNWPEFDVVCKLTLEEVVPCLLLPLQEEGRVLKPCLIHGDCWDGNTAMDAKTGEAFVFDACSFYGHNEYDTGNWRAPRHRLSDKEYISSYHEVFPPSEPAVDWDARNLLYSLAFNIGNTIYIPGSQQRQVVYDDMKTLCNMFCPERLRDEMMKLAQKAPTEASVA